jgi:hypothetical protein
MLKFHKWIGFPVIGFLLIFAFSCASREEHAGLYKAQEDSSQEYSETYIELKESGEGTWTVADEEESFSWYIKGDELRLNTKLGGVIVGQIQNDTIKIVLFKKQKILFKKSKE